MKTYLQKTAMAIGAFLILSGPASPQTAADTLAEAQREQARVLIAETLQKRLVREVSPAVVAADVERIVSSLSGSQIQTLLRTRDAAPLLDKRRAAARQSRLRNVTTQSDTVQNATAKALGDADSELLFVPVAPCRIFDTRLMSGGFLAAGQVRNFLVAGTNAFLAQGGTGGGCGIPDGATEPVAPAVVINFIAVGPAGPGNLRAWEFGQPAPNASVINYSNVPGLNIANGVVVPIEGTASQAWDLSIQADVSGTHVVADVTGYFTRFPREQFAQKKDFVVIGEQTSPVSLADGACKLLTTCVITAPANTAGKVIIRSYANVAIDHTQGTETHDRIIIGPMLSPNLATPNCTSISNQVTNMDYEMPDIAPTASDQDVSLSHGREFTQSGGTTRTYGLQALMFVGASAGDQVESSRMICTFIPD